LVGEFSGGNIAGWVRDHAKTEKHRTEVTEVAEGDRQEASEGERRGCLMCVVSHRLYYFWSIWNIKLQRHPLERCLTNSEAEQR
jgi:hypothetical protein